MREFVDAVGTAHPQARGAVRIVSLVPSITELVCDLGLSPQLVGRTGFCIHPQPALRSIPKVGGTKDVDLARVRKLRPTHVIVNIDENLASAAAALREFVPHLIVTHPQAPHDNPELYQLLGGIFDCEARAMALSAEFSRLLARIQDAPLREPQRVLYLIWRGPWMTVARDTYISRTLALFNWHTVPENTQVRYPEIDVGQYSPQVDRVLLSSEPYPFRGKHLAELRELGATQVDLIDGEMVSWYGSRAIAGLQYLDTYTRSATARPHA